MALRFPWRGGFAYRRPVKVGLRINLSTELGTIRYIYGRIVRDVQATFRSLLASFVTPVLIALILGVGILHVVVSHPFKKRASRLSISVSLISVLALCAFAVAMASRSRVVIVGVGAVPLFASVAVALAFGAFPSDRGWYLLELREQLVELFGGDDTPR